MALLTILASLRPFTKRRMFSSSTERNALRANLVRRAEKWRWSSLWRRQQSAQPTLLTAWPVPEPSNWLRLVNKPQTEAELEALRRSVNRGTPFGSAAWTQRTARRLGLASTLRPRGRPKKQAEKA